MTIEEPGKEDAIETAAPAETAGARKRSRAAWAIGGAALAGMLLVGAVAGPVGLQYGQNN